MNAGGPKGIQGYPGAQQDPGGGRGVRGASSSQEDAGGTRRASCALVPLVLLARLGPHGVGNRGRKNCQKRDKNSFREPLGFPASGTQGLFGSATVFLGPQRVPSSQQARCVLAFSSSDVWRHLPVQMLLQVVLRRCL